MTQDGVKDLYLWLTLAWPLVIRAGADEEWKRAKMRELYKTYRNYDDKEVQLAFEKWTNEHDKYPTTKNIINELEWYRVKNNAKASSEQTYQMPIILDDGTEYFVEKDGKINFTWNEFRDIPRNIDRLDPDEWERRFKIRRKQVLSKLYPDTPERRAKGAGMILALKRAIEEHANAESV